MQVIIIALINAIFLSHLSYIVIERRGLALKSRKFWVLVSGLLLSLYISLWYQYQLATPFPNF